jgi:hypothetical protein
MGIATDNYYEKMLELAHSVKKLGVEKVAEAAETTVRKVNRFLTDPLTSKNSDILKIKRAVEKLSAS